MHDEPIRNPMRERPLSDFIDAKLNRRDLLKAGGKLGMAAAFAGLLKPTGAFAHTPGVAPALTFKEIAKSTAATHHVAPGYDVSLLIRWGDSIKADAPKFNPYAQSVDAQLTQFGFNNDFLAYMPFPYGSNSSTHGLLCSNHEYTSTHLMFPGMTIKTARNKVTKEQVDVELAAHGHGTVEIRRTEKGWEPVVGSPYNRRMNPYNTPIAISGPAAGNIRMRTSEDPEGKTVIGTLGNCAGGVTPWGTVLVSEENFNSYFGGDPSGSPESANHARYGLDENRTWYGWYRFYKRWNVEKEANEPNRFGWVVEYDPYDTDYQPVKRTWLGRFKHESATTAIAPDGRVVVYSGDDEKFEYIYRYVSNGKYDPSDRKKNFDLLNDGTLYVAKFMDTDRFEWLPLVFGQGPLTETNGFHNQGDVLIETRRAADLVGATPMDRPEGITINTDNGHVYVSLTNNNKRTTDNTNIANTRANNIHGHILTMIPPGGDHAADTFEWSIFLQGGNPKKEGDDALYHGEVSENGWLSCPDNLITDPHNRLWIATDGMDSSAGWNDGLYAAETRGERYGIPKLFFNGPAGCEICSPHFTPDGKTLFLAIQHPGDGGGHTFDNPASRWPDFKTNMPPRPSVIAITKKDNGIVGS